MHEAFQIKGTILSYSLTYDSRFSSSSSVSFDEFFKNGAEADCLETKGDLPARLGLKKQQTSGGNIN